MIAIGKGDLLPNIASWGVGVCPSVQVNIPHVLCHPPKQEKDDVFALKKTESFFKFVYIPHGFFVAAFSTRKLQGVLERPSRK